MCLFLSSKNPWAYFLEMFCMATSGNKSVQLSTLNDTHREKLGFTRFSTRTAALLLLRPFSYVYSIN